MECKTYNDALKLLHEIKERIEAIEVFLRKSITISDTTSFLSPKVKKKRDKRYTGKKTKDGTFVEFATESWLWSLLSTNNPMLIFYTETLHHEKCCLCQKEDISLTAKTIKKREKL